MKNLKTFLTDLYTTSFYYCIDGKKSKTSISVSKHFLIDM